MIYAGDIKNEDSILEWLLVQMDPSNEAIDDVEGEELESAIENFDSIAVFICKNDSITFKIILFLLYRFDTLYFTNLNTWIIL